MEVIHQAEHVLSQLEGNMFGLFPHLQKFLKDVEYLAFNCIRVCQPWCY